MVGTLTLSQLLFAAFKNKNLMKILMSRYNLVFTNHTSVHKTNLYLRDFENMSFRYYRPSVSEIMNP